MADDFDTIVAAGLQAAEDLIHRSVYDPVKAREYYLRTRKLKGRQPGSSETMSRAEFNKVATGNEGTYARPSNTAEMRASRRKKLLAEKAKLERRIQELQNALDLLVEAAKKRAGVKPDKQDKKSPEDPTETAAKNEKGKKDKPLTEAEKRKKREASREAYAKENHTSLAQDVQTLHKQVKDIRAKLEQAVADARRKSSQSNHATA